MQIVTNLPATLLLAALLIAGNVFATREPLPSALGPKTVTAAAGALQGDSLCARTEHIVFSCRVQHSAKDKTKVLAKRPAKSPTKIVSLCASPDLDKERGYLQYRFGLPGRIELEFPKSRQGTQQLFTYTHYFRYQFDLTEISFNSDGYEYAIVDDYNGEETPAITLQGVSVTPPGKSKEVMLTCRTKPKADYSNLADVLNRDQE